MSLLVLAAATPAVATPWLLLDSTDMAAYRAAYRRGDSAETGQVRSVLTEANRALTHVPYTVTTKPQLPPSSDRHDFMSQAPYFWPDPTKPSGKPYVQRDGLVNPEVKKLRDDQKLTSLCQDVKTLALAYYFTNEEKYAAHATRLLQVFFLDPATRMNPNLNFGQGIPGTATGRSYGIIRTRRLVAIPEAVALLSGSKSLTNTLISSLQSWFREYTQWLTTSKLGQEAAGSPNNHGTFYDVQVVDFALFTGNPALARQVIQQQTLSRIAGQLAPDGAQPLELARTRPWNYTTMNLHGWVQLAVLARRLGVDLWHYITPDGRGLRSAVAWFRPYLLGEKHMAQPDVTPAGNAIILVLYHRAKNEYPELGAEQVLARYPECEPTPWAL